GGTRSVHVLRMCLHGVVVSPVIADNANDSQRCTATTGDGNGDGHNGDSHYLFTPGPEIGSTLQSVSKLDIFSTRENRRVRCSLLHTVSIRRRYGGHNARIARV